MQAHLERFDLHGLTIAAQHALVASRWKAVRYCARPPLAQDRLQELPDGRITLQLKTPWSDGSTISSASRSTSSRSPPSFRDHTRI
jgi:hypothetical protein